MDPSKHTFLELGSTLEERIFYIRNLQKIGYNSRFSCFHNRVLGGSEFGGNLTPPTPNLSGKKIVVLHASQIS